MKLLELCEPIFQYVCRINRAARGGHELNYELVRSEIQHLLSQAESKANMDTGLKVLFERIRLPLIYFIDSMIVESNINFAADWDRDRLAYDDNQLSGDEAFFDDLDEALSDTSREAEDVLLFLYACLGLGFTGFYKGQPEFIEQKINEILPRIRHLVDTDVEGRVTPMAYNYTNTAQLYAPASNKVYFIMAAFIILVITVLGLMGFFFISASDDLSLALSKINSYGYEQSAAVEQ